jgi:GxxExxY protein
MSWIKDIKSVAQEVFNNLGEGYKEEVYEEALAHELRIRKISYERQRNFEILYKGYRVGDGIVDLIINPRWCNPANKEIVLEVKRGRKIQESYKRQAQVYMISLNIHNGAVLCFADEVHLEPVSKPEKILETAVIKPSRKNKKGLEETISECAKSVYEYFGKEFTFRDDRMAIFTAAVGVEFRLRKIHFSQASYDITYKSHKVSSYNFDFVFDNGQVAEVAFFEKEEKVADLKDELKFTRRLLGLSKAYFIAFPKMEKGQVKIDAV